MPRSSSSSSQPVAQLVFTLVVGEVERAVVHPGSEPVPHLLVELVARVLLHRLLHPLAELVVALLAARHAHDAEVLGQQLANGERIERRHQLLRRQVARRAEDDEDAAVRPPAQVQALCEGVVLGVGHSLPLLRRLDRVATELVPQGRVHLGRERLVLA